MTTPIEARLRWSGSMIVAGLSVLLLSLLWAHPLSFMLLLAVGCPLILAGVLLYLWALAVGENSKTNVALLAVLLLPIIAYGCSGNNPAPAPTGASGGGLPPYDPSTATAKVFGKLVFEGTPPAAPSLKIGSNDPYCQKSGQSIFKHSALVTEAGAPRNVIVYVRSGFEGRTYAVPQDAVVLDQQGCVYMPHVLTIMKGQKLKILNSDPTFHNVHAQAAGSTIFNIAQAAKGAEDIQTFSKAAMPLRIGCDFHNWMGAHVGVFEHPFHTTSGDSGRYELRLPPGRYEVVVWHEKFGEQSATVELSANASVEKEFKFSAGSTR